MAMEIVPLTPMDQLPPPGPQQCVIYLGIRPGLSNAAVFAHLQQALYRTIKHIPWLSGKIHVQPLDRPGWRPGSLEIRYNPNIDAEYSPDDCRQIRAKELDLNQDIEDLILNGFPVDAFEDADVTWVAWKAGNKDVETGVDILSIQVNFIPGACLIVPSFNHATCDGTGMAVALHFWAEQCRLNGMNLDTQKGATPSLPTCAWDRTLLANIWSKEATGRTVEEFDPVVWRMLGLDPPKSSQDPLLPPHRVRSPLRPRKMTSRIFYMSAGAFASLRKEASAATTTPVQCSSSDLIIALMWRVLVRTRLAARHQREGAPHSDEDPDFELHVVVDVRDRFSHTLPQTYMGNCIVHHRPTLSYDRLIGNGASIASVADAVYASGLELTHDKIMDAYALLSKIKDWTPFYPMRHMAMDDAWTMNTMTMFSENNVSFGDSVFTNGGRVLGSRLLMSVRNRGQVPGCYVLPRKKNGGLELMMSLFEDEWPFVMRDAEFSRFPTSLI